MTLDATEGGLPQQLLTDIDSKLTNNIKDDEIFDKTLKSYIENISAEGDKEMIRQITRQRLALLKDHIRLKHAYATGLDAEDKEKLLKDIEGYESADGVYDQLRGYSENKDENGQLDPKRNGAGEDLVLPSKIFDFKICREMFLKGIKWLNEKFKFFDTGFLSGIEKSIESSIAVSNLARLALDEKKNESFGILRGRKLSNVSASEMKPFFGFFEKCKIDVTNDDFWPNILSGKAEINGTKVAIPQLDESCFCETGVTEKFYDAMNSIEDLNPELLKDERIIGEGFARQGKIDGKTGNISCYYRQYDPRWANKSFGLKTMRSSACGPTCMAMVVSKLTEKEVLPPETAKGALDNHHWIPGVGVDWDFMRMGGEKYGVKGETLGKNRSLVEERLRSGKPVVASMGPGHFTSGGHYIVLTGIDADGKVTVLDPGRESRNGRYDLNFVFRQSKNFWSYSV